MYKFLLKFPKTRILDNFGKKIDNYDMNYNVNFWYFNLFCLFDGRPIYRVNDDVNRIQPVV